MNIFFTYASKVLELENGADGHCGCHAQSDEATTVNVAHAPGILSFSQLLVKTKDLLLKDGKQRGIDFKVPSKAYLNCQFMPNNPYKQSSERHSDKFPYIKML